MGLSGFRARPRASHCTRYLCGLLHELDNATPGALHNAKEAPDIDLAASPGRTPPCSRTRSANSTT
jgi:hypothetical protein